MVGQAITEEEHAEGQGADVGEELAGVFVTGYGLFRWLRLCALRSP